MLKQDTSQLNFIIEINTFRARSINYILKVCSLEGIQTKYENAVLSTSIIPEHFRGILPDTINHQLIELALRYSWKPIMTSFNRQSIEELQNTGLFAQISNPIIKTKINNYYSNIDFRYFSFRGESYAREKAQ